MINSTSFPLFFLHSLLYFSFVPCSHFVLTLSPSLPFLSPSSCSHFLCSLPPLYYPPSPLPPSLSSSAEFGRWKQARYWTRWSTTTRQFFIYALLMAWWSPAPRTAPSLSGTWPRRPTSAYAVSSWDTGPLSMWLTLMINILCLPQGTAPSR